MIEIIISALCIYAVSTLVVNYDGPFGILERLRELKPLQGVTSCVVCMSFWVSLPFLVIMNPLHVLAAYGLVILATRNER